VVAPGAGNDTMPLETMSKLLAHRVVEESLRLELSRPPHGSDDPCDMIFGARNHLRERALTEWEAAVQPSCTM